MFLWDKLLYLTSFTSKNKQWLAGLFGLGTRWYVALETTILVYLTDWVKECHFWVGMRGIDGSIAGPGYAISSPSLRQYDLIWFYVTGELGGR